MATRIKEINEVSCSNCSCMKVKIVPVLGGKAPKAYCTEALTPKYYDVKKDFSGKFWQDRAKECSAFSSLGPIDFPV